MRILIMLLAAAVVAGGSMVQANDRTSPGDAIFGPSPLWDDPPWMFAQLGGPQDPRFQGQGRMGGQRRMQQQRKHLEQLRMLKMLELLDLDENQEVGFLTTYRNMRQDLQQIDETRAKLVDELAQGLGADSISDAAVNDLVDKILQADDQRRQVHREFIQSTGTLLTPQQLGRLVIFHERFERELLDQVRAFREFRKNEQPDGPPSP